jgi:hypothetical protein
MIDPDRPSKAKCCGKGWEASGHQSKVLSKLGIVLNIPPCGTMTLFVAADLVASPDLMIS